jgi:hypothetical protein
MGFGSLLDAVVFVWVVDKVTGKRKRVRVSSEAERQRLLAQNRKLKEQLARKRKKVTKKKTGKKR